MCLAIPGKIIRIKDKRASVYYDNGSSIEAAIIDGNYKTGDYVVVQGKLVVDKVPARQVESWQKFIKEGK